MNARQSRLPTAVRATARKTMLKRHASALILQSIAKRMPSTRRSFFLLMLIFTAAFAPALALFDPGEPAPDKSIEHAVSTSSTQPSTLPHVKAANQQGAKVITDLVSLVREPVSIHPNCRKVTDLFDNVCPNPWTPWSASSVVPRSELVICPLPASAVAGQDTNAGPRERVYAITGTITLPSDILPDLSNGKQPSQGIEQRANSWPNPGDEGFWRQRDEGEVEWVPTEPRALLEAVPAQTTNAGVSPAPISDEDASLPPPEQLAEAVQAKEYDAWSERIGGEESDTWLGFDQWRDKHLAAEREKAEQEKQRIAANKKHKSEKHKAGGAQSDVPDGTNAASAGQTPEQRNVEDNQAHSSDDRNNGTAAANAPSTNEVDGAATDAPEKRNEHQAREQLEAPEAATSEQGAIPALGNPSDELGNLKHRWNFASLDCAAVVHRTNPSAKFSSSILSEKKDRYLLSPCSVSSGEQQFVVVELCDEIKIDTVVMANFEFFSRMFKRFRVRVSRNLNGGDDEWVDLGTFRARNVRSLQVFKTVNPSGDARFFRYVRIDFLEHYGSEYYCPLSLLRVYGLTQMDDYIREEEEMRKAREVESRMLSEEAAAEEEDEVDTGSTANVKSSEQGVVPGAVAGDSPVPESPSSDAKESVAKFDATEAMASPSEGSISADATSSTLTDGTQISVSGGAVQTSTHANVRNANSTSHTVAAASQTSSSAAQQSTVADALSTSMAAVPRSGAMSAEQFGPTRSISQSSLNNAQLQSNSSNISHVSQAPAAATHTDRPLASTSSREEVLSSTPLSSTSSIASQSSFSASAQHPATSSSLPPPPAPSSSGGNSTVAQQHGGSESIYRTITKRLNMLEANATLSLQYMEHTRQSLRETFARMERNQRDKIGQMLRELNASNWRQIESLKRRQQVDLQQALFEFDMHRQQTDAERRALLAQVHLLSNEIMLEKRFGIAQLILLLGLFVFMALTRGSRATPLINQGLARLSRTSSSMRFSNGHNHQSRRKRGSTADSLRSSDDTSSSPSSEHVRRYRGIDEQRSTSWSRRAAPTVNDMDRRYADVTRRRATSNPANRGHSSPHFASRGLLGHSQAGQNNEPHHNRSIARRTGGGGMLEYVVRMRGGINAKAPVQRRGRIMIPLGAGGQNQEPHDRLFSIDDGSAHSEDEDGEYEQEN